MKSMLAALALVSWTLAPRSLAILCMLLSFALTGSPPALATSMTPDKIRSWVYAIPIGPLHPDFNTLVANSRHDLVIFSGGLPAPINRAAADPANNKLLIGYIGTCEASSWAQPSLFPNGGKASIIGKPIPGYTDLYSVQYWDPQWQRLILEQIDGWIAAGADGVFLDMLSDDAFWANPNPIGNVPYANATAEMVTFIQNIRAHIASRRLSRPFYVIGNNPWVLARAYPHVLSSLDMVMNETLYWRQPSYDGLTSVYAGTADANVVKTIVARAYANIPVLGNDYPNPLSDYAQDLRSFEFYSDLGWLPSVTNAYQDKRVFSSGPFMFMARPNNPIVQGARSQVNFISGGSTLSSTLVGGDAGNVFIGGPGSNSITGGAGDDTIYAHPKGAALKNRLRFEFDTGAVNPRLTPKIQILINGQPATPVVPITQNYADPNYVLQSVEVDTSTLGPITSVEVVGKDMYYEGSSSFNNVFLRTMTYCSSAVDLSKASLSQFSLYFANDGSVLLNQDGRALIAGPDLPACTFPANTSSTIDGGEGTNTVVYRSTYSNYTILRREDGSWLVSSKTTAEGPDTLIRVQNVQFTDYTVQLSASLPVSLGCLFAFASSNYPGLFSGAMTTGALNQFTYAFFAGTGNYLALDHTSGIWALGPMTNNVLTFIGMHSQFKDAINAWSASRGGCS